MRVLLLVQGEGRGHLTQALSFTQILQKAGHEVVGAMVGVTANRKVPAFFQEAFPAPIIPVQSPGLVYCPRTNALQPAKTMGQALRFAGTYWRSLKAVRDQIWAQKPDLVVNFYELLGGLTYAIFRPSVPMICIAHQYLLEHPNFPKPRNKTAALLSLRFNTYLTTIGASERLALSFDWQPDLPQKRLRIVPPLLRQEVIQRTPGSGNYFLAYTTQPGLVSQIVKAHHSRPDVSLRCFHSGENASENRIDDTLSYHAIHGERFLDAMQHCNGVVTTAGFESVCEALYMGKPVLMIPQPNHIEQTCNALDGERAGVGIGADSFDLDRLLAYLPHHSSEVSERFQAWYHQGYFLFLSAINRAVNATQPRTNPYPWHRLRRLPRFS